MCGKITSTCGNVYLATDREGGDTFSDTFSEAHSNLAKVGMAHCQMFIGPCNKPRNGENGLLSDAEKEKREEKKRKEELIRVASIRHRESVIRQLLTT